MPTSPLKPGSKANGAAIRMDTYFNEANFIPCKRYLLQIILDGRRKYNLTRFKNRGDALAEKTLLAAYRGILPLIIDTRTGLEVVDEPPAAIEEAPCPSYL